MMRTVFARRALLTALAATVLCAPLAVPVAADVTGEGDVSPAGPVDLPIDGGDVDGDIYVGGTPDEVDPSEFGRLFIDLPAFTAPLTSDNGYIAGEIGDDTSSSIGQVIISGFLSEWTVRDSMNVGVSGYGTLELSGGAIMQTEDADETFTADDARIGIQAEAQGFAFLSGLGTRWSHSDLTVGEMGFGVVEVEDGARLFTYADAVLGVNYDIGNNEVGNGRVSVSGLGSRWVIGDLMVTGGTDELIVGAAGRGEIEALDEGVIRAVKSIVFADASTAYGKGRVNGRGSLIWANEDIVIANPSALGARADVYVENEGILRADDSVLVGERGFVNLAGGTVLTGSITNGGVIRGDGVLDTGPMGPVVNNGHIRAAASVANIRERLLVTGPVTNSSGVIEAIGGEIEFLGAVTGGEIREEDGILRFRGGVSATSLVSITLSSDPGGIFVDGGASLSGDLVVEFADGYAPLETELLTLMSGGPISGTFSNVMAPADWTVNYLPTSVVLRSSAGPPLLADSDFNLDGDVDGLDLAAWESGFGTSPGALKTDGDADNNGSVDGGDFLLWQRSYGFTSSAPAIAAVPEPGTVGLALLAVAGLALRRRRA